MLINHFFAIFNLETWNLRDRDRDLKPSRLRPRLPKMGLETSLETETKSRDSITDRLTWSHGAEGWKGPSKDTRWMIVHCATFFKSLNPRIIEKSVSDMLIRIRLPFRSSFFICVSGCKLTYPAGYSTRKPVSDHSWRLIATVNKGAWVTFSDSDSAPVPKFLKPYPAPGLIYFKFKNPTPVQTPVSSGTSELLSLVSCFASHSKGIKFGDYFFDVCCVNEIF